MAGFEYYFNHLDANSFQRLINSILVARFGESIRLMPSMGSDGGRDGETASYNPYFEFQADSIDVSKAEISQPLKKGRYLFQVKHHRTVDTRLTDARRTVISDFEDELKKNVLNRQGLERVNFFFLITNVPSSEKIIAEVDKRQAELRKEFPYLYADIWWSERVISFLDQMPFLWNSFPSLFAGGKVPFLAGLVHQESTGLPRSARMAIERQYRRDSSIKFRQIGLEKSLQKLFTSLEINSQYLDLEEVQNHYINTHFIRNDVIANNLNDIESRILDLPPLANSYTTFRAMRGLKIDSFNDARYMFKHGQQVFFAFEENPSEIIVDALSILIDENIKSTRKIILEGGPGQGKSTLTQMLTQIYRQQILGKDDMDPENRWSVPKKFRLPFRIELRLFTEWLTKDLGESVEEYLAFVFKQDSGGSHVTVDDIYNMVEKSPVILVFDGLDEVGNDDLRNEVLTKIAECIQRFEESLSSDIRVIITTRPPAVTNCREYLTDFKRMPIAPMKNSKIKEYVKRWVSIQLQDDDDRREVQESFEKRQNEPHVQALAKNPMQLSVLLHFIRFKGVAFPDRRAELYREYFRTVIDRDVEKSTSLREQRGIIEALHQFLGYKIHALTEAKEADGSLSRSQLLELVEAWLKSRGSVLKTANELFKLGEERLGLIIALKGEGEETRYGYEVQPIREYFAAAFINDDIEGNAHEVFQAIVRRPYWREVALFLAGLRRPNEKADLIARAKSLDNDEQLGWRQDGRHLTLQLLQEGVFSEPPHIFSDALDFVFDLLDPKLVRVQYTPKNVTSALLNLLKQDLNAKRRYTERLQKLLYEYNTSNDELVVFRLYELASQLFEPERIKFELLSYKGRNPETIANLRLLLSADWNINLKDLLIESSFWQGVPDFVWSIYLWRVLIKYNFIISTHSFCLRFHELLLKQFIVNVFPVFPNLENTSLFVKHSNLAISRLINCQRIYSLLYNPIEFGSLDKILASLNTEDDIDFTGLDENLKNVIIDLLKISYTLFKSIVQENKNVLDFLRESVLKIESYIMRPGLESQLACKFAVYIWRTINISNFAFSSDDEVKEVGLALWNNIKAFFPRMIVENEEHNIMSSFLRSTFQTADIPIQSYRLENGKIVEVLDILSKSICRDEDISFAYLDSYPFEMNMIRPLVEKCRDNLPALMASLSDKYFIKLYSAQPLLTQDVQRILKIVRHTDDFKILGGALVALSSSRFLRLAGTELLLKMISADHSQTRFAGLIFEKRNNYEEISARDREIINEVATDIIRYPESYTFDIISKAVNYLAENSQISLPSLISLEKDLMIHVPNGM